MFIQPQVLLYNFSPDDRTRAIRRYLNRDGILIHEVQAAEFLHPLGYLFRLPGFEPDPRFNLGGNFHEEMLVLKDFSNTQLDAFLRFFRENQLSPVDLKAVLTPVTQHWNSLELYTELKKEHETMKRP
ncbi:MAG: DUF3783 domain-containing protein [Eubacteriales bacterium]|nr:DUF3783 domain-containing protein [Eubacteriales bacterium]